MEITFYEGNKVVEFAAHLEKSDFLCIQVQDNMIALLPNGKFYPIHTYIAHSKFLKKKDLSTFIRVEFTEGDNAIQIKEVAMSFVNDTDSLDKAYSVRNCSVKLTNREEEFVKELIADRVGE